MNYLEQLKITGDILRNISKEEITSDQISLVLQALTKSGYKVVKDEEILQENKEELPKTVYLRTVFFHGKATLKGLDYVNDEGDVVLNGKSERDLLKKLEKYKTR